MMHAFKVQARRFIRKLTRALGYDIVSFPKLQGSYEHIHIKSHYAPWKEDSRFIDVFKQVSPYSLVDQYRCYELWQLVDQTNHLCGSLIEVGVWRGGTGALIAKQATGKVYLCDTFCGVVKASEYDPHYQNGEHSDTSIGDVETLLRKLKLTNVEILKGIFPDQTGSQIEEEHFRFCHIDVDTYQSATEIVDWVWPRMVVGGVIVFDDYGFSTTPGITQFVNEQKDKPDRMHIHNLNGHAIWVKSRSLKISKQTLN